MQIMVGCTVLKTCSRRALIGFKNVNKDDGRHTVFIGSFTFDRFLFFLFSFLIVLTTYSRNILFMFVKQKYVRKGAIIRGLRVQYSILSTDDTLISSV